MKPAPVVRDILYLDFDKAASIWSQFDEGLLERVSVTEDSGKDQAAGTTLGIPGVAEISLGADYLQKTSTLRSKTLHHDLLNRVERRLMEAGLVTDLAEAPPPTETSPEAIRSAIGSRPYLRAEGNSILEDYRRILATLEKLNDLIRLMSKAGLESAKQSPEYTSLLESIAAKDSAADQIKDRNQKAVIKSQAKAMRQKVDALLKSQSSPVEDWMIDGMRLFINTFMPTRINFRIYPFQSCPSFQVLCNLKRECFLDSDLEHLLYGYGYRSNVPLAVFGLITSLPKKDQAAFDPMKEFEDDPELARSAGFEKGFRGVFSHMEDLEAIVRFSRYPNVTVHPIAVYRSFTYNSA